MKFCERTPITIETHITAQARELIQQLEAATDPLVVECEDGKYLILTLLEGGPHFQISTYSASPTALNYEDTLGFCKRYHLRRELQEHGGITQLQTETLTPSALAPQIPEAYMLPKVVPVAAARARHATLAAIILALTPLVENPNFQARPQAGIEELTDLESTHPRITSLI